MCHACQVISHRVNASPGHTRRAHRPVCVIGLGLIGGSLLRDLVASDVPAFGADAAPEQAAAARADGFDASGDVTTALQQADKLGALIVIAVPMGAVESLLRQIAAACPNCAVIDVVSVKQPVLDLAWRYGLAARYVGTHPMAGTAFSGWSAGRAGLFAGAPWVIGFDQVAGLENERSRAAREGEAAGATDAAQAAPCGGGAAAEAGYAGARAAEAHTAGARAAEPAVFLSAPEIAAWTSLWAETAALISLTGARIFPVQAPVHDAAVARISHLPHILAETLAVTGDRGGALARSLAAGSFRDGTRVAGTAPALVRAMCETNAEALVPVLDEVIAELNRARNELAGTRTDTDTASEPSVARLAEAGFAAYRRFPFVERTTSEGPPIAPSDIERAGSFEHVISTNAGRTVPIAPGENGWVKDLLTAEAAGACICLGRG